MTKNKKLLGEYFWAIGIGLIAGWVVTKINQDSRYIWPILIIGLVALLIGLRIKSFN